MTSYIGSSSLNEIHPNIYILVFNECIDGWNKDLDEMVWLDEIEIGWSEVIGWNMSRWHTVIS